MASPENTSDKSRREREHQDEFYSRVARFTGERVAGRAYGGLQAAIYARRDCDLSVFRLQLNRVYHVAVLGHTPPKELERKIHHMLAAGDATLLPPEVMAALITRRLEAVRQGPWVERHHRPAPGPTSKRG